MQFAADTPTRLQLLSSLSKRLHPTAQLDSPDLRLTWPALVGNLNGMVTVFDGENDVTLASTISATPHFRNIAVEEEVEGETQQQDPEQLYLVTYKATYSGSTAYLTQQISLIDKPNILFVSIDDLNDWVGYLSRLPGANNQGITETDDPTGGHPNANTPNLDKLANTGRAFRHAYCSAPLSNPSRTAIMTGHAPHSTGIYQDGEWHNDPALKQAALPFVLNTGTQYGTAADKGKGYRVYGAGKVFFAREDFDNFGFNNLGKGVNQEDERQSAILDVFDGNYHFYTGDPSQSTTSDVNEYVVDVPELTRNLPGVTWGMSTVAYAPVEPGNDEPDSFYSLPYWVQQDYTAIKAVKNSIVNHSARAFGSGSISAGKERPFFWAAGIYMPHVPMTVQRKHFEAIGTVNGTGPKTVHLPRPYCYFGDFVNKYGGSKLGDLTTSYTPAPLAMPSFYTHLETTSTLYDGVEPEVTLIGNRALPALPALPSRGQALVFDNLIWNPVRRAGHWYSMVHAYLASAHFADERLGDLLESIRANGFEHSTVVVVWGDHGWNIGEKGHVMKTALWERTTRVPLIMRVPGMREPGVQAVNPVSLQDLYPTLCGLSGIELDSEIDGVDLGNMLEDPNANRDGESFTALPGEGGFSLVSRPVLTTFRANTTHQPIHAVRGLVKHGATATHYRYIQYFDTYDDELNPTDAAQRELYNLTDDPGETKNLLLIDDTSAEEEAIIALLVAGLNEGKKHTPLVAPSAKPVHPLDISNRFGGGQNPRTVCINNPGYPNLIDFAGLGCGGYRNGTTHSWPFPPLDGYYTTPPPPPADRVHFGIGKVYTVEPLDGSGDSRLLCVPIMVYNGHLQDPPITKVSCTLNVDMPDTFKFLTSVSDWQYRFNWYDQGWVLRGVERALTAELPPDVTPREVIAPTDGSPFTLQSRVENFNTDPANSSGTATPGVPISGNGKALFQIVIPFTGNGVAVVPDSATTPKLTLQNVRYWIRDDAAPKTPQVLVQSECMSQFPFRVIWDFDRTIEDEQLRALIASKMVSGAYGWPCEAEDITTLVIPYTVEPIRLNGLRKLSGLQCLNLRNANYDDSSNELANLPDGAVVCYPEDIACPCSELAPIF
jgi:arylsulfatase A-like enzyme